MRVLITGSSRGLGRAMAIAFAREHGANAKIALLSRSHVRPSHPSLEGNLLQLKRELVREYGSTVHTFEADLRDPIATHETVRHATDVLEGGIDVLVNNASALDLAASPSAKRIALVMDVNARGTLAVASAAEPGLRAAQGAMITLSPPIDLTRHDWIGNHPHYTVSKYAMTLATLGFSARGIRAATLWPKRTAATAATARLEAVLPGAHSKGRDPDEVANAVLLLAKGLRQGRFVGDTLFDEEVDRKMSVVDAPLDLFVDETEA